MTVGGACLEEVRLKEVTYLRSLHPLCRDLRSGEQGPPEEVCELVDDDRQLGHLYERFLPVRVSDVLQPQEVPVRQPGTFVGHPGGLVTTGGLERGVSRTLLSPTVLTVPRTP